MNLALSMWAISLMGFFKDRGGNWMGKALKSSVSSLTGERTGLEGSITLAGILCMRGNM
jgi:hypothetical protein